MVFGGGWCLLGGGAVILFGWTSDSVWVLLKHSQMTNFSLDDRG